MQTIETVKLDKEPAMGMLGKQTFTRHTHECDTTIGFDLWILNSKNTNKKVILIQVTSFSDLFFTLWQKWACIFTTKLRTVICI